MYYAVNIINFSLFIFMTKQIRDRIYPKTKTYNTRQKKNVVLKEILHLKTQGQIAIEPNILSNKINTLEYSVDNKILTFSACLAGNTLGYSVGTTHGVKKGLITFSDHKGLYLMIKGEELDNGEITIYSHACYSNLKGDIEDPTKKRQTFGILAAKKVASTYVKDYIPQCLKTNVEALQRPDFLIFGEFACDRREKKKKNQTQLHELKQLIN